MDWESDVFFLAGGNLGWGKRTIGEPGLKGLVLGVPEQLWVLACLHACGLVDVAERVVDTWQDFEQQINDYSTRRPDPAGARPMSWVVSVRPLSVGSCPFRCHEDGFSFARN